MESAESPIWSIRFHGLVLGLTNSFHFTEVVCSLVNKNVKMYPNKTDVDIRLDSSLRVRDLGTKIAPYYANIPSTLIFLEKIKFDPRICIVRGRHRLLKSSKNVNFGQFIDSIGLAPITAGFFLPVAIRNKD